MSESAAHEVDRPDADRLRVLRVRVGDDDYALEAGRVAGVTSTEPVTRVPNTPPAIAGVARLRGETTLVVDIRHLLGIEDENPDAARPNRRAVVFDHESDETPVAIEVDAVERNETHEIDRVAPVDADADADEADAHVLAAVIETEEADIGVVGPDRLLATALGDQP